MKKINILLILLCLTAAANAQKYIIHVQLADARSNAKAYLEIGRSKDSTAFLNGTATFEGEITSSKVVVVHIDFMGKGDFDHYYNLYLSPGTTDLKIADIAGKDDQFVTGNKYAAEFNDKLLVPVTSLNAIIADKYHRYALAKQKNSADTAMYLKARNEAIFNCFQIPQNYVKNNPSSPLCIVALKMLGKGDGVAKVNVDTLRRLFMSLTATVQQSEEGVSYQKWLSAH